MNYPNEKAVADRLASIISDAFNRSIGALERAGALDTTKLAKHYKGIGSKYYDIVTEQIELTVRSGAPWISELFIQDGGASDRSWLPPASTHVERTLRLLFETVDKAARYFGPDRVRIAIHFCSLHLGTYNERPGVDAGPRRSGTV